MFGRGLKKRVEELEGEVRRLRVMYGELSEKAESAKNTDERGEADKKMADTLQIIDEWLNGGARASEK